MAISVAIFSLTAPYLIKFFHGSTNKSDREVLVGLLRQARTNSMTNLELSSYGVNIGATTFTLYKGPSYETRDTTFDYVFDRSPTVEITGPSEIHFSQLSGRASVSHVVLSNSGYTTNIEINSEGRINY